MRESNATRQSYSRRICLRSSWLCVLYICQEASGKTLKNNFDLSWNKNKNNYTHLIERLSLLENDYIFFNCLLLEAGLGWKSIMKEIYKL